MKEIIPLENGSFFLDGFTAEEVEIPPKSRIKVIEYRGMGVYAIRLFRLSLRRFLEEYRGRKVSMVSHGKRNKLQIIVCMV